MATKPPTSTSRWFPMAFNIPTACKCLLFLCSTRLDIHEIYSPPCQNQDEIEECNGALAGCGSISGNSQISQTELQVKCFHGMAVSVKCRYHVNSCRKNVTNYGIHWIHIVSICIIYCHRLICLDRGWISSISVKFCISPSRPSEVSPLVGSGSFGSWDDPTPVIPPEVCGGWIDFSVRFKHTHTQPTYMRGFHKWGYGPKHPF